MLRRIIRIVYLLTIVFVFLSDNLIKANADTLYLKNGHKVEGLIKSEDENCIEIDICQSAVKFKKSEIESIKKSTPQETKSIRRECEEQKKQNQKKLAALKSEEKLKPKDIEFVQDNRGIVIDVILNKSVQASLLLDTGSTVVVLTKDVARRLGIDLSKITQEAEVILADGAQVKAKRIVLESIVTQGVEAENVDAAILLDGSGVFKFGDGLLGMSFLKRFNFKVDQKSKKLILEKFK